jgi:hypothetical protein
MGSEFLRSLLELLANNRGYPKYQHERRIDIFVNFFLRDILDAACKTRFDFVLPEFPLKKSTSRRSTNADYLAFSAVDHRVLLCEFKTSHESFERDQMERYFLAQEAGWEQLVRDAEEIPIGATARDRKKYQMLLSELRAVPPSVDVGILYIAPDKTRRRLEAAAAGREYAFLSLESIRTLDIVTPYREEWALVRSSI